MRHARLVLALSLAALVVLAGCGGNGGATTTDAPTETTTADGTTVGPDGQLAASDLPAGLSPDGINNGTALVEAHEAALAESGAKSTFAVRVRSGAGNQTSLVTQTRGADGSLLLEQRVDAGFVTQRVDLYANETTTFQRTNASAGVGYSVFDRGDYVNRAENTRQLPTYLDATNFTVEGVAERDGETVVRLRATEISNRSALRLRDSIAVENFSGTAVVDLDGRIHSLELNYDLSSGGQAIDQTVTYDLETVGVETVERPDWTATATEEATIADVTFDSAGGVVTVTNEGGDAIPAGTRIGVVSRADGESFAATLESELAPGETAYVYRNDTSARQGTVVVGSAPTGVGTGLSGEVIVTVSSSDGLEIVATGAAELGTTSASVRRVAA